MTIYKIQGKRKVQIGKEHEDEEWYMADAEPVLNLLLHKEFFTFLFKDRWR